jgi:hypothetical protein
LALWKDFAHNYVPIKSNKVQLKAFLGSLCENDYARPFETMRLFIPILNTNETTREMTVCTEESVIP